MRPREKNGSGGKAGNRDDEAWHDAREDWWEEVAYEEAKTGGQEEEGREGSSTPAIGTPAVGASADVRPRVAGGGGEGTKAMTDEGAERSIQEVTFNEGGTGPRERTRHPAGCVRPSGPRGSKGCSSGRNGNTGGCGGHRGVEHRHGGRGRKVPSERVREEERNAKRAMRPREGQATSTGTMVDRHGDRVYGGGARRGACIMAGGGPRNEHAYAGAA